MNLRSPLIAMLWEQWRLTRVEAAQRVAFALVVASGALAFNPDKGEAMAAGILLMAFVMFWFSISRLNGGQMMDGYKPGFPLYLLYARPVTTAQFVLVALLYDALSCLVLYLLCAGVLMFVFGKAMPLFSVALWIVSGHLCYLAIQWSTRNRVFQWVGAIAFSLLYFYLIKFNFLTNPVRVEFSVAENVLMFVIGIVSIVGTIAGVSHQRSGNAVETVRREARVSGYPDWLINAFGFACPTSSATRAQIWFELKSSGVPILAIGAISAIAVVLLFAFGIPFPRVREYAVGLPVLFLPLILLLLSVNAFGIRRKQGRMYMSAFEATQPYGVARMAGLKILVRSACMLIALAIAGVSFWLSSSLVHEWTGWVVEGKEVTPKLLQLRDSIAATFGGQTGRAYFSLATLSILSVIAAVALGATYPALRLRYGSRPTYVLMLIPIWGIVMISLAIAVNKGVIPVSVANAVLSVSFWTVVTAAVLTAIYLFWSGFRQGDLTLGYVSGAILISAAFVVACLPASGFAAMLLPALIPLIPIIAAPWSLARIRHT